MTVRRNGALSLSMVVRCLTGNSACGDHIVFGISLLHRATTGALMRSRFGCLLYLIDVIVSQMGAADATTFDGSCGCNYFR
ncbi:hypothetical protein F2Q69_00061563 [Brassica cretica]|uniref:Uncharacterized protein n=1 Tax=Brassica cretica TaxID=69181 RepID=A0A8S9RQ62_BRACR|nr:hypothetical protein F2Q69_00061563 [Brassica cretica]